MGNLTIGYARVSTDEQNLDLQRDALHKKGCSSIFQDVASGKNAARPELMQCLRILREGDTFVVWRLDRLGRSLADLVQILNDLAARGVIFESLTERIETGSAMGKLFFHLTAAFAEYERNIMRERTQAGLAAARARGRTGGRPAKVSEKASAEMLALHASQQFSIRQICDRYQISPPTFYRHLEAAKGRMKGQK